MKSRKNLSYVRLPIYFLSALFALNCTSRAWQMQQAPLMTQWAAQVNTNAPLPEYPRPQMVRSDWLNLNAIWQFQPGATNDAVPTGQTLTNQILVPYPMESAISGVMKYYPFSWYRRTFTLPGNWTGRRILLHLDAVDWQSTVYVNGQNIGTHKGGYDPITYDITGALTNSGQQELIVQVYNPVDNGGQPRGKQTLYPGGIMYTSSSGIWQPAWLEPVDPAGIDTIRLTPDIDNARLQLAVNTLATNATTVFAVVSSNGTVISSNSGPANTNFYVPVPNAALWTPESPFLYDLKISTVVGGITNDTVTSYFGMRKISVSTLNGVPQILLNNQAYFEMGPLDQGFWPDGLYTAPTEAALKFDLQEEKAFGFNMVRKHIKVERQRWYYWADKFGLLVWQDMPSCNSYTGSSSPPPVDPLQYIAELSRMVQTHWNSPAIIMWDTFNESQGQQNTYNGVGQTNTAYLVQLVKTLDPSRLVNQASGGSYYGVGDVYDEHSYPAPGDPVVTNQVPVDGEYGGIGFQMAGHLWNPALAGGNYVGANTTNDIATIYDSFADDLIYYKPTHGLNAAVYTQITDVENECNGLLTYDRVVKPDPNLINASNVKAASARLSLTPVLPTSQSNGITWRYTTTTPAATWYQTNFDDSAWSSGLAGFGTAATPGIPVRTTWNTSNIWIRQTFSLGSISALDRSKLVFYLFHDEDCEIYLNGTLAGSATGYITAYGMIPMTTAGQNALITNGVNTLAVHCHQTTGGQGIDVGISKEILIMNALVTPTDYIGRWPFDETIGSVANDATGNGNNGIVVAAAWNAAGQINGCLNFSGTNSFVQISNEFGDDFSITFWLKTTQTGAPGNWYGGAGLVDAFTAVGANDFGTALNNGKFSFGIGNPETTITSPNSVNDGAWHQCVATRERVSGNLKMYIDGSLAASGSGNTNSVAALANVRFGSLQTGSNFFNGSLDDIRFYNRVLGDKEITALYADGSARAAAPAAINAVAGNNQVVVNWSAVPLASTYEVQRSQTAGGPYSPLASTATTNFTDLTANNGTTYYYVVSAINSLGFGANSTPVSATPTLASALQEWFAADAITSLTNGAPVAAWPDQSGNHNDATQTSAGNQPSYVINALNGLPVVRFSAAMSNYLAFARSIMDDFTIVCVFRTTQGVNTGTQYYQGAGLVNAEVANTVNDFGMSINTNGRVLAGTGNPDVTAVSGTGYNDGRAHVATFIRVESAGTFSLYLDGVLAATNTGGTQSLTSPTRVVLGAQQTLANFLSGDLAEVKVYNTALAPIDRNVEEGKLECKYGISGASVPLTTPSAVVGVSSNRVINLAWSRSSDAATFSVSASTNLNGPFSLLATNLTNGVFSDARALIGRTNYYQITAFNGCLSSAASATAAIYLPPPALALQLSSGQSLSINWPAWASGWNLYYATNLNAPVQWFAVTNAVGSNTAQFSVTLSLAGHERYFRLTQP